MDRCDTYRAMKWMYWVILAALPYAGGMTVLTYWLDTLGLVWIGAALTVLGCPLYVVLVMWVMRKAGVPDD